VPELDRRTNAYPIVSAATPTVTNSAGVDQDGTDYSYFIPVGVGSSKESMYMLLDSGAGTTWVMGSTCQSAPCSKHNTFGPSNSKTYQSQSKTFSIAYGSGSVSGELAQDTLVVAGLSVSMTFGVANVTSDDFTNFPFDGILGLAMSDGATDNLWTVLKSTKSLPANIFSISLNRESDGANTGEITFGATDAAKFTGAISYTSVSSQGGGDWAIALDDMGYNGKSAGIKNRIAYIDTGTSYAFGPAADVAAIHKLIPGATSSDGVTYTVPCTSNMALTVTFSGITYSISSKDWLSGSGSSCTSNIYGHEVVQGSWLLGDVFLKNVYAVFDVDQSRVGFASKPSSSASTATTTAKPSVSTASPVTLTTNGVTTTLSASTITATGSSMPGLSGHETSVTAPGSSAAETSALSPTPTTPSSPGEQLESNKYVSIVCIVAVIAMVAA
jgi:hypothetical protein